MASMATALMTPFVPGAGPPPTTMPMRLMGMLLVADAFTVRSNRVLEALAEGARQMGRVGEPVHPGGVREILGFERIM